MWIHTKSILKVSFYKKKQMITFLYQKGDYDMSDTRTCPNCGAPVPEGICQYCGTVFESTAAPEDYPEVICKYAGITFHEIRFYSGVILFSVIAAICIISQSDYLEGVMFALVFSLPGMICHFGSTAAITACSTFSVPRTSFTVCPRKIGTPALRIFPACTP